MQNNMNAGQSSLAAAGQNVMNNPNAVDLDQIMLDEIHNEQDNQIQEALQKN